MNYDEIHFRDNIDCQIVAAPKGFKEVAAPKGFKEVAAPKGFKEAIACYVRPENFAKIFFSKKSPEIFLRSRIQALDL